MEKHKPQWQDSTRSSPERNRTLTALNWTGAVFSVVWMQHCDYAVAVVVLTLRGRRLLKEYADSLSRCKMEVCVYVFPPPWDPFSKECVFSICPDDQPKRCKTCVFTPEQICEDRPAVPQWRTSGLIISWRSHVGGRTRPCLCPCSSAKSCWWLTAHRIGISGEGGHFSGLKEGLC